MADCVLDANVLVAWFDPADSLHARASTLLERIEREGTKFVLLDVLVGEAVSVLCRRCYERKQPAKLPAILAELRRWLDPSNITWFGGEAERLYSAILDLAPSSTWFRQPPGG